MPESARLTFWLRLFSHTLIALLVACHILAFMAWPSLRVISPDLAILVRDALLVSQPALLVMWMVLGPGDAWIRCLLALALMVVLFDGTRGEQHWMYGLYPDSRVIWFRLRDSYEPRLLRAYEHCVADVLLASLAIAVLVRVRGFSLRTPSVDTARSVRPQFSIRGMLVATALMALGLALGLRLREAALQTHEVDEYQVRATFAVPHAALAMLTVWGVLAPGRAWWRLLVLAAATPALACIAPLVCGRDHDAALFIRLAAAHTSICVATFSVLRMLGYRLVGTGRPTTTPGGTSTMEAAAPTVPTQVNPVRSGRWRLLRLTAACLLLVVLLGYAFVGHLVSELHEDRFYSESAIDCLADWIEGPYRGRWREGNMIDASKL